jgi:hypothetical protein
MFALTGGELALALFLFVVTWGSGLLPAAGERLGRRLWAPKHRKAHGE